MIAQRVLGINVCKVSKAELDEFRLMLEVRLPEAALAPLRLRLTFSTSVRKASARVLIA